MAIYQITPLKPEQKPQSYYRITAETTDTYKVYLMVFEAGQYHASFASGGHITITQALNSLGDHTYTNCVEFIGV